VWGGWGGLVGVCVGGGGGGLKGVGCVGGGFVWGVGGGVVGGGGGLVVGGGGVRQECTGARVSYRLSLWPESIERALNRAA